VASKCLLNYPFTRITATVDDTACASDITRQKEFFYDQCGT
jgi:hypothetical protein